MLCVDSVFWRGYYVGTLNDWRTTMLDIKWKRTNKQHIGTFTDPEHGEMSFKIVENYGVSRRLYLGDSQIHVGTETVGELKRKASMWFESDIDEWED